MWKQNVDVNLDPYIHQGGNVLTDWYGWCLAYVQTALNAGWAGSNAWDCWNNHTVNKHEDWNLPGGVYVPIFFSGYHDLGHAAIYKDGQVWSTPVSHKPTADHWNSIQEVEQQYGVHYVGWAEGLGGTTVAQWHDDTAPYTISAIEPRQVRVKPNHYKWNLAQPTFQDVVNNPITTSGDGTEFTATGTLTRSDAGFQGYTYYLDDVNTPHGWNSLDCEDVAPPQPMPAPYVPPAAPVPVPLAKKYQVLTNLAYYDTLNDATWHRNSKGSIPAGTYYDFDDNGKLKHLGIDNMKALFWINTEQNVAPVVVPVKVAEKPKPATTTEWKATRVWFYPDSNRTQFDKYELQYDVVIRDLDNKGNDFMVFAARPNSSDNAVLQVYGTVYKDGTKYYLLHLPDDTEWRCWYAIPFLNTHTGKPYLLKYSELYDTTPTPKDYSEADLALEAFAKLGYKVMDVVERLKIKVKKRFNLK